jgi:DNA-directed RNA polymerase subunit M/transcription elongation factor TFIIS
MKKQSQPNESDLKCPLCDNLLIQHPKGSAILFVCPSCDFKILTTKELFLKCFTKKVDAHEVKKQKISGVEEMRYYIELMFNRENERIAFLFGSLSEVYEELREELAKSKISRKDILFLKFGRLTAVLDLFSAYFDIQKVQDNKQNPSERVSPYIS